MGENRKSDLERWLTPFVCALRHKTRAWMCSAYIVGLIGAGDRKSVLPMAARDDDVEYDQLHHFIASGAWDIAPLEDALLAEADRMVVGADAWLIIDDTALPKKGVCSVGVAPQYASSLGKTANCQSMVSLTLASHEVPVMVGLRLFLPESWTSDPQRLALEAYIAKLDRYDLLILDDTAYVSKDRDETSVLFELIAARYERRSLLIIANQLFGEWGRVFPDQAMTLAAIDRLVHHATILEMNVESYRRKAALNRKRCPGRKPIHAKPRELENTAD